MNIFQEYENCDALDLAQLIKKGDISAFELLEVAISRVEKRNPRFNAVVTKMYDQARTSIALGLPEGPLKGVPFLLKDLGVFYKGVPTTYGCRLFAEAVPDHDSELVARYRKAGLVIFGKTNTPEFGMTLTTEPRLFGPCRNPWNPAYTTGGSSGGSATAVTSGMVPVAMPRTAGDRSASRLPAVGFSD
jgi:amidase